MQSNTNLYPSVGRPQLFGESSLDIERGSDCIRRQRKCGYHAVTLALLDRSYPFMRGDCDVKQFVVASNSGRRRLLVSFPEAGRSLDVAEQECHRARRQRPCSLVSVVQSQDATSRLGCSVGELCHIHAQIVL